MSAIPIPQTPRRYTAAELRRMPQEQRDVLLTEAAKLAESDYANDPVLTGFDAFGGNDLHGYSSGGVAETR
jgi:hypothetical protein